MVDRVNSYEGGRSKVSMDFGIKESKTASTTVVGTTKELAFGREVTFCKVGGTAIGKGVAVQGPAPVANHLANPVRLTAAIGAKEVSVCAGATAISADQYQNGFLQIASGTGTGDMYMIERHGSAASGTGVTVYLKDGLEVALNTASIVNLIPNQCNGIIAVPAAGCTAKFIGVTLASAVINGYVWAGSKGQWPAKTGTAGVTAGSWVQPGCAAGTLELIGTAVVTGKVIVGQAVNSAAANADTYYVVDLY